MKVTIYELLGMVRDGNPPKKIKISELIYTFNDMYQSYYDETGLELTDNICLLKNLDEPVEILEEEKKIPEKLKIEQDGQTYNNFYIVNQNGTKCYLTKHSKMIVETLNSVIDYLENKGDE